MSSRRVSGRTKHEAKVTFYLTNAELLQLDHTILEMRRLYGIKVDRGRFVREAILATSMRTIAGNIVESESA